MMATISLLLIQKTFYNKSRDELIELWEESVMAEEEEEELDVRDRLNWN